MHNYQKKFNELINNQESFDDFQMELSSFLIKNKIPITASIKTNHEEFLKNIESMFFFDKMQAIALLSNITTQTLNKIISPSDIEELKKINTEKADSLLSTCIYQGNTAMFEFVSKFKTPGKAIIGEAIINYTVRFDPSSLEKIINNNKIETSAIYKVDDLIYKNKKIDEIKNCFTSMRMLMQKISEDKVGEINKIKESLYLNYFLNKKNLEHSIYTEVMSFIQDFLPNNIQSQRKLYSQFTSHISYDGLSTFLVREQDSNQKIDPNTLIDIVYDMMFEKIKESKDLKSIKFLDQNSSENDIYILREKHYCSPSGFLYSDIYINIFQNLMINIKNEPISSESLSKLQNLYFVISENLSEENILYNYHSRKLFIKSEHIPYIVNNKEVIQLHNLQSTITEKKENKINKSNKI